MNFLFGCLLLALAFAENSQPVLWKSPCLTDPLKSTAVCDESLSADQRAKALVGMLRPDEKSGLFSSVAKSVPRLGIPAYNWWSEALHGVAASPGVHFGGQFPCATSFPEPILTAAAFDKQMFHAIGRVVGTEGRAFHNYGRAGLTFWAPNINIFRDPRWGRGQETPGEDPYLSATYAREFVSGMQSADNSGNLLVSSCCKHFDAYSLEQWHGVSRHQFNAVVSARDLQETYLPAFYTCVRPVAAGGAGSSGVMCSYNAVNGVPMCANKQLMEPLRTEHQFAGYVTSDCGAVDNVKNEHHYTKTGAETVEAVLSAGMDLNCGVFVEQNLLGGLANGTISRRLVDQALEHLFAVQIRLSMYYVNTDPYSKLGPSSVNTPEAERLALTAAERGIVLLKNEDQFLPLKLTASATIALIGPSANATSLELGNYHGRGCNVESPLEAVTKLFSGGGDANWSVVYQPGCASVTDNSTQGFQAAIAAAKQANVIVFVGGLSEKVEREGLDRTTITWPGVQAELLAELSALGRPIVLVVLGGGPIDLSAQKKNEAIRSIVWAGYPGQSGGTAIANVLAGKVSPAGRLPRTVYEASFASQVSMFDMNMAPNTTTGYPGRTYRFYTGPVVYPFGYGLSYTTFQTKIVDYSSAGSQVTVAVQNTGHRTSDFVLLVYASGPNAGKNGNPLKTLVAFDRLYDMKPNEKRTVTLPVAAAADKSKFYAPGTWFLNIGDDDERLFKIKVY